MLVIIIGSVLFATLLLITISLQNLFADIYNVMYSLQCSRLVCKYNSIKLVKFTLKRLLNLYI